MVIKMKRLILMLSLCVMLSLFGCSAVPDSSAPVTTTDDIRPSTTVDEVVAATPVEKVYPYLWLAEDPEQSMELIATDARFASLNENLGEEDWIWDDFLGQLKREGEIDYIVTPEEAANLAGSIFEESFGLTFNEEMPISLQLLTDGTTAIWYITNTLDLSSVDWLYALEINATTGEIGYLTSGPDYMGFYADMFETEKKPSFVTLEGEFNSLIGYWDETHPQFKNDMTEIKDMLLSEIEGSLLLQGASVVKMEETFNEMVVDDTRHTEELRVLVTLDDGRKMLFYDGYDIATSYYDIGEYPLKMFSVDFDYVASEY